jgi:HAD superfamily phosphoserine phosphatase-like hydrolase
MKNSIDSKKKLAFYDFDKTITLKDTLIDFVIYSLGINLFLRNMVIVLPYMFLAKFGMISRSKLKLIFLNIYFKTINYDTFLKLSFDYSNRIDDIINCNAMNSIQSHLENGTEVIIVSASCEEWIKPWAKKNGINKVISTKLRYDKSLKKYFYENPNCNGIEKLNRIKAEYPELNNYEIYAYGDSRGDKNMLSIATYKFYKSFN